MDRYSPDLGADTPQKLGRPTPGELLICPLLCNSDPLIAATTLKRNHGKEIRANHSSWFPYLLSRDRYTQ